MCIGSSVVGCMCTGSSVVGCMCIGSSVVGCMCIGSSVVVCASSVCTASSVVRYVSSTVWFSVE